MLGVETAAWLIGLVCAVFFGLAIGNFATNPIYRLPRKEPIFGRKPYCGDCNTELRPIDLFPILSWFSTMGKCRYCGAQVPVAYVIAEILITVLFVVLYTQFGFSDAIILLGFGGTALLMLVMMEVIDRFFSMSCWWFFVVMGMLMRTLTDGNIQGFTQGAIFMAFISLGYWKLRTKTLDFTSVPSYFLLWVAAGVWLQTDLLMCFALMWGLLELVIRLLQKPYPALRTIFPLSATYAVAVLLPIIFPKPIGDCFGWLKFSLLG